MRISYFALVLLLFVAAFASVGSVYFVSKLAGNPLKVSLRRCAVALAICLVVSVGLVIHLAYYFPQRLDPQPVIEQAQPTPEPTASQAAEFPVTDYAEILRNSEEYDGQEVRVAGRIARLGYDSNKHSFYFRDRLGFLSIGKDFEVKLSREFAHFASGEGVSDYYTTNQYVLVQGIWGHSTYFPCLFNAQVISTGEEAKQVDQVFMDEWEALERSYSEFPIVDYVNLEQAPNSYLGQRVRTVGQVQTVGNNAVAGDIYFHFRNPNSQWKRISFSLQGCPPEMQKACIEGEYMVISCLVDENDYGSIWFSDCFVECVGDEAKAIFEQFYTE